MNLGASAIVLRPRGVTEVFDLACRFTFWRSLGLYMRLSAAFVLPCYGGVLLLRYLLGLDWWWIWLIALPMTTWLEGPFTIAASRVMFNEEPAIGAVLKAFGGRVFSYSVAIFLKLFFIGLSAVACLVPAALVAPLGLCVPEVNLLEGASAWESWGRSRRLLSNRYGDAFLTVIALVMAQLSFALGFELLGQALVSDLLQLGEPFGTLWKRGVTPFALAGLFVAAPFCATARFLQYIDTRTRDDGWDIQVKMMGIVATHEQELAIKDAPRR